MKQGVELEGKKMFRIKALALFIQKCHPRTLFKLLLISLGACFIFLFKRVAIVHNQILLDDQKLGPAFTLINGAETSHLDFLPEFTDNSDETRITLMTKMRESMKDFRKRCIRDRATYSKRCQNDENTQKNILTLCTTWIYEKEKFPINNRTMFNWRTLPNVNLVVFTNSTEVKHYSEKAGFKTFPITEEASGAPVLPTMFTTMMKHFNSEFYAFANGDILFTRSLIDTLKHIQCNLNSKRKENGILIIGRRLNIPATLVTDDVATSWERLDRIASKGSLFQADAEDYFITDKSYPWQDFLPVVIGRRAYDNWVVAYSRYHNITVVDATESIQCLHQTLESRGNYEGLEKGSYNKELVDKLEMPFSFHSWGKTFCSGLKSWVNLCGQIVLSERFHIKEKCNTYHIDRNIFNLFGLIG